MHVVSYAHVPLQDGGRGKGAVGEGGVEGREGCGGGGRVWRGGKVAVGEEGDSLRTRSMYTF